MSDKIRAFIAVDMPIEIQTAIRDLQQGLNISGVKPVNPSLIHVTLKFLGETPQKKIEKICRVLDSIDVPRFEVHVKGVGVFPKLKNPRVVWVGLEDDSNLQQIVGMLEEDLSKLGFERERKKFSSHLTIARVKRAGKEEQLMVADFVRNNSDFNAGTVLINEVKLKKSVLTPQGPIYSDIHTKELK
ncbi:MAG: RNA 2',3'-cyclic phosphodiesterase [Candidatus Syntropharchaeales archaeon]